MGKAESVRGQCIGPSESQQVGLWWGMVGYCGVWWSMGVYGGVCSILHLQLRFGCVRSLSCMMKARGELRFKKCHGTKVGTLSTRPL